MISAKEIQGALYKEFRGRGWTYFSANTYCFKYEADMLGVTSSKFVTEFEIKRSRADYFSELVNKKEKHYFLENGKLVPNYFYFVCEKGLLKKEEIQKHCGLIYIEKIEYPATRFNELKIRYSIEIVKPAPKLHGNKISDYNLILALRALMFKYFEKLI